MKNELDKISVKKEEYYKSKIEALSQILVIKPFYKKFCLIRNFKTLDSSYENNLNTNDGVNNIFQPSSNNNLHNNLSQNFNLPINNNMNNNNFSHNSNSQINLNLNLISSHPNNKIFI